MNSPPEKTSLALRRAWEPAGRGVIEEYLDDFCLPLAEVMPEREVADYRLLAREHLYDIEDEFLAQGMSEHFARHAALREHGDPHLIGKLLQKEWLRGGKSAVPMDRRSLPFAAGLTVLHTLFLCVLWKGIVLESLPFDVRTLPLFLVSAMATGHISALWGAVSRGRGKAFITGAASLAQIGAASLVLLSVWGVNETLFTLPLYLIMATIFGVKSARREHSYQCERLLHAMHTA